MEIALAVFVILAYLTADVLSAPSCNGEVGFFTPCLKECDRLCSDPPWSPCKWTQCTPGCICPMWTARNSLGLCVDVAACDGGPAPPTADAGGAGDGAEAGAGDDDEPEVRADAGNDIDGEPAARRTMMRIHFTRRTSYDENSDENSDEYSDENEGPAVRHIEMKINHGGDSDEYDQDDDDDDDDDYR